MPLLLFDVPAKGSYELDDLGVVASKIAMSSRVMCPLIEPSNKNGGPESQVVRSFAFADTTALRER
jgi:hypothetical protein